MTEPGFSSDADRAEQEALLDPPAVSRTADAEAPAAEASEADALEQQLSARPGEAGGPRGPLGDHEANDADLLEQTAEVPLDEDDVRG